MTCEALVSELFESLISVERVLAEKSIALRRLPGWTEVTADLSMSRWNTRFAISGYVDGELDGHEGVCWTFDARRAADAWVVGRSLDENVRATAAPERPFPDLDIAGSRELAAALPSLVAELCALEVG